MNDENDNAVADEAVLAPAPEVIPAFHYSLILAEVVYSAGKNISSHRVQLFSKADVPTFPAGRLGQLQNSAAHQVQNEVNEKDIKVLEVIILNITGLGCMTDEEFWGSRNAIPGATEVAVKPQKPEAPVSIHDNVVSLKRP